MIFGDSIFQTASIVRWVSAAGTATDHTIFDPSAQVRDAPRQGSVVSALHRLPTRGHYLVGITSFGPYISRISVSPSQPGQYFL